MQSYVSLRNSFFCPFKMTVSHLRLSPALLSSADSLASCFKENIEEITWETCPAWAPIPYISHAFSPAGPGSRPLSYSFLPSCAYSFSLLQLIPLSWVQIHLKKPSLHPTFPSSYWPISLVTSTANVLEKLQCFPLMYLSSIPLTFHFNFSYYPSNVSYRILYCFLKQF